MIFSNRAEINIKHRLSLVSRYGFDEANMNEMLSEQYYIARYRQVLTCVYSYVYVCVHVGSNCF